MKIAITGSLGHIGSYLIREFSQYFDNLSLILFDNLSTQRFSSLFNLPSSVTYQFFEKNVGEEDISEDIHNVDVLIHLAAITDALSSFKNSDEVRNNNLQSTENVLKACIKTNIPMIFTSTTSVYGKQTTTVDENCSNKDLKPQSPYAEVKLLEEEMIREYIVNKHLKAVICRLGTIFGPSSGMRFHTAVNKFCWQAFTNKPITVWKTAYHQKRPYLYIDDALRSFVFIIKNHLYDGEVYNLLTTNETVCNVLNVLIKYKPNIDLEYVESEIMNQLSYEVLCDKFQAKGFCFKGTLDQGIKDTFSYLNLSN